MATEPRVQINPSTVQRTVEVPVTEAVIELTEAEVEKALVEYVRVTYAAELPPRKLLAGVAGPRGYIDIYYGHEVTLRFEAE